MTKATNYWHGSTNCHKDVHPQHSTLTAGARVLFLPDVFTEQAPCAQSTQ